MSEQDPFFRHHFSSLDPGVAASFTPEQRRAIKMVFGARSPMRHAVDVRRSISVLGKRFYIVVLAGSERRSKARLHREGMASRALDTFATLAGCVVLLVPVVAALYAVTSSLGVDLLPGPGLNAFMDSVGEQLDTALR